MNKGYFGYISAIVFNKTTSTIEVILNTPDQSRLMRHKVGAMEGLTKAQSRDLWYQLHAIMDKGEMVQFFYRGNWKAWFDVVEIIPQEDQNDATFAQMIGDFS